MKNVPNFAMMLCYWTIEFKQKKIMTLYAFVFTVKYAKKVLGVRIVQNNQQFQHVSLYEIDIQSQRLAENVLNHASILLSNRIHSLRKFLQLLNQATFTTLSLFNLLAVPAPHLLSLFLSRQPYPPWKSQIAHLSK